MKPILFSLIIFIGCLSQGDAQVEYSLPPTVKKILFLGNSITWGGEYIIDIETYFRIRKPNQSLEFINAGLSSETVSGLSEPNHAEGRFPRPDLRERLARVLKAIQPDLVIACYGMNDGIYLAYDEARFEKFKAGIQWLHEEVMNTGIPIIHVTPPVFDERAGAAYANVLDLYSDWLISRRYTSEWKVIDIHWPMKKYLADQRSVDSSFVLAQDGVHPNATGHWLMAKEILNFLGEEVHPMTNSIQEALSDDPNVEKVLPLVTARQKILRNAWLTRTGHKRPNVPEGLPLSEAQEKARIIEEKIEEILK